MWQEILFEKGMRSSNLWPLGINSGFSPPSKLPRQAEMLAEFENSWERSEEELVHLSYIPEFTCRSRDCSSPCPRLPTNLSLISAPGNKNNQNLEMLFPDGVQLIKKNHVDLSGTGIHSHYWTQWFSICIPSSNVTNSCPWTWSHGLQMAQSCLFTGNCPLTEEIAF